MSLVVTLAFVAGFLLIFGLNLLYADIQRQRQERVKEHSRKERRLLQTERAQAAVQNRELYELAAQGATALSLRKPLPERLGLFFEQAGVKISPGYALLLGTLLAVGITAGVGVLSRRWGYAGMAGLACGLSPCFYVALARRRRMERLLFQLPDAFDMISRMMRAGRTFPQAMQSMAEEGSPPLSDEFGYCYDQQHLGMSPDVALRDLARRTGLLELQIFVVAVTVHRQTGGNLSNLLEKLAEVIRDRYRIRGVISALTAEGRLQVYVLLALPVLMLFLMNVLNPAYTQQLFDRAWLLGATAVSMIIGWAWMRRIVKFEF